MYASETSLPHLLPPSAYSSLEQDLLERRTLLHEAWHMIGTTEDLARPGDFLTRDLFGTPIQIRNEDGEIIAFSNVCAHRHCLLTHAARGSSPRIRCQYHGWEYDGSGRTRRIPAPKNFVPLDREVTRLTQFRAAACGGLVFVCLSPSAPALREHLGELHDLCAERFGTNWRPFLAWEPDYPANWKIPVENSLESYHVPSVHPTSFREDPGEQRSEHHLGARHTYFRTRLPFAAHSRIDAWFQRAEGWFVRRCGETPRGIYTQHHVFPNLLFSFTDAVSLCQCVVPTSPTTARAVVRQFGHGGGSSRWRRGLAGLWGRLSAAITRSILREDLSLFADIQRGMSASPHAGVLGRCEERIHAFQSFVRDHCHENAHHD